MWFHNIFTCSFFSSRYIDSISAQLKSLRPHKGDRDALQPKKKNQSFGLQVAAVPSPALTDTKHRFKLDLQILSES